MGRKYPVVQAGEWVNPVRKGYKMACCDCGLVHALDFRLIKWGGGKKIIFRAFRDERATAAIRRETRKRDGKPGVPPPGLGRVRGKRKP